MFRFIMFVILFFLSFFKILVGVIFKNAFWYLTLWLADMSLVTCVVGCQYLHQDAEAERCNQRLWQSYRDEPRLCSALQVARQGSQVSYAAIAIVSSVTDWTGREVNNRQSAVEKMCLSHYQILWVYYSSQIFFWLWKKVLVQSWKYDWDINVWSKAKYQVCYSPPFDGTWLDPL